MTNPRSEVFNGVEVANRIEWFNRDDQPGTKIFSGLVTAVEFREGFGVHTLNARALRDFEMETERGPGVILNCFLEGATDAWLDGKHMGLGRRRNQPIKIALSATDRPLSFARRSSAGEYVRKVSIQMLHEWMEENGLKGVKASIFEDHHHTAQQWVAKPHEVSVLEKLATTSGFLDPLTRLQAEGLALEIAASSLQQVMGNNADRGLTTREQTQLKRMEELIYESEPLPDLRALARASGLSISSLRRLVHKAHGCAPLAHARRLRLSMAKNLLEAESVSIIQAARAAGFTSPENFATAFKRAYGHCPSDLR